MSDYTLTTEDFAALLRIKPETLRWALCQRGSYYGVIPVKLPNGRLMWPTDSLQQLIDAIHQRPQVAA